MPMERLALDAPQSPAETKGTVEQPVDCALALVARG
ncbi:conserved hypothetical protein [Ralstonia solanacearum K60]|nr:conserved hypothetical protein [Ralstonia solanacearum K60]